MTTNNLVSITCNNGMLHFFTEDVVGIQALEAHLANGTPTKDVTVYMKHNVVLRTNLNHDAVTSLVHAFIKSREDK